MCLAAVGLSMVAVRRLGGVPDLLAAVSALAGGSRFVGCRICSDIFPSAARDSCCGSAGLAIGLGLLLAAN